MLTHLKCFIAERLLTRSKRQSSTVLNHICPGDVVMVSYPRSGSTWIRYILSYLLAPDDEPIDRERTLELVPDLYATRDWHKVQRPAIIKSHEPYTKQYEDVVYLLRDGRDVACSYYDYYMRNHSYNGSFSNFLRQFLDSSFDYGSWPVHVVGWLDGQVRRKLIIRYEDLWANSVAEVLKICNFLGLNFTYDAIQEATRLSTYVKITEDAGKDRTGLAKGPGVWSAFFSHRETELFQQEAGYALERAGYLHTVE